MKGPRHLLLALLGAGLAAIVSVTAIATQPAKGGSGAAAEGPPVSPEVRQMLLGVSADRIQQTIEKLVSFGTRHAFVANRSQPRDRRRHQLGLRSVPAGRGRI